MCDGDDLGVIRIDADRGNEWGVRTFGTVLGDDGCAVDDALVRLSVSGAATASGRQRCEAAVTACDGALLRLAVRLQQRMGASVRWAWAIWARRCARAMRRWLRRDDYAGPRRL